MERIVSANGHSIKILLTASESPQDLARLVAVKLSHWQDEEGEESAIPVLNAAIAVDKSFDVELRASLPSTRFPVVKGSKKAVKLRGEMLESLYDAAALYGAAKLDKLMEALASDIKLTLQYLYRAQDSGSGQSVTVVKRGRPGSSTHSIQFGRGMSNTQIVSGDGNLLSQVNQG